MLLFYRLISITFCFLLKTDLLFANNIVEQPALLYSNNMVLLFFPSFILHRCLLFALYNFMFQSPVSPGFEVGTIST